MRVGEQDDSAILQSISTPCIDDVHFKEEETNSVGELLNTCFSNCSEMAPNWQELDDPIFYGQ